MKMQNKYIYKIIKIVSVSLLFLLLAPIISFAQSVSIQSDKEKHNIGDTFLVKVKLNSQGKQINSLEGKVIIPKDLFEVKEIMTGESFVSLWIERPALSASVNSGQKDNEIIFAGGLPGGYSGSDGIIFTFVLKAIKEGSAKINIIDFNAYLNDGMGTPASPVLIGSLLGRVSSDPSLPVETYVLNSDNVQPEEFNVAINNDPTLENGKYFVSFFAVDKGSGIDKYEVLEKPWLASIFGYKKVWQNSRNPQVLYYQKWGSTVVVKAFDISGNIREESISKPMAIEYKILLFILILIFIFILYIKKIIKWYNKKV